MHFKDGMNKQLEDKHEYNNVITFLSTFHP